MKKSTIVLATLLLPSLALAGARVSAEKKVTRHRGSVSWGGAVAIDNNAATAWMVPGESQNRGEWIEVQVPKSDVTGFAIHTGWAESEETFADYARPKTLKVDALCCDGDDQMTTLFTTEVTLEDVNALQQIDIEDIAVGNEMGFGGLFRLTVQDTYAGQDYPNLAVSELEVQLKEFDLPVVRFDSDSGTDPNHMVESMTDGNRRSYWSAPVEGAGFVLASSGYGVSSVGLQAGPRSNARPKKVKVSTSNRSMIHDLENTDSMQFLKVPSVTGYTGSAWGSIEIQVLEVYPGSSEGAELAISELTVRGTNFDGL
ncbi:MAG: hypothetical protein VXW32_12710 [Myxococcota bacterium]|jgi:hypothetical protein|nr:hypothetical protein [Myxococcota bacterium]